MHFWQFAKYISSPSALSTGKARGASGLTKTARQRFTAVHSRLIDKPDASLYTGRFRSGMHAFLRYRDDRAAGMVSGPCLSKREGSIPCAQGSRTPVFTLQGLFVKIGEV